MKFELGITGMVLGAALLAAGCGDDSSSAQGDLGVRAVEPKGEVDPVPEVAPDPVEPLTNGGASFDTGPICPEVAYHYRASITADFPFAESDLGVLTVCRNDECYSGSPKAGRLTFELLASGSWLDVAVNSGKGVSTVHMEWAFNWGPATGRIVDHYTLGFQAVNADKPVGVFDLKTAYEGCGSHGLAEVDLTTHQ